MRPLRETAATQTVRRGRRDPETPRRAKVARPTSPDEQEDVPAPALVSPELFAQVAEQLQENRRRHREQKQGAEFLLGGLLVCHQCDSAYCGRRQRRRAGDAYVYYRCLGIDKYRHGGEARCSNRSVNGQLEETVWADLCDLLHDPERVRREWERRWERPAQSTAEASRLEKSIAQLKCRIGRVLDAYENGWMDKAEFEKRMRHARERLQREQEALASHQQQTPHEDELRMFVGQFETFAEQVRASLQKADFTTKRNLLRLLIKRIEIDEEEIRIVYKVQPRPFATTPAKSGGILQHCLKFCSTASRYKIRNFKTYALDCSQNRASI